MTRAMNKPEHFFHWLGTELENFIHTPISNNHRFHYGQELILTAKRLIDGLSWEERQQVFAFLTSSHIKHIGNFVIPYDKREEYDWIEGVLATIEAF